MTDRHAVASAWPHSVLTAGIGDATAKGAHPMGIIAWIVVGAIVVVFVANLLMGTGRNRGMV